MRQISKVSSCLKGRFQIPIKTTIGLMLAFIFCFHSVASHANHSDNIKNSALKSPIVVSIKPLYSLTAQLTNGITEPVLLVKHMQSAHHYAMHPSERRLLSKAAVIIWTGPAMETYLTKIINQQRHSSVIITALQAENLDILKKRNPHSHDAHEPVVSNRSGGIDPHIWLSIHNTIAISQHIAKQLILADPENREHYNKNLATLLNKINQTQHIIKTGLKNQHKPFIAYHDAFQYFENENALNYIDSINFNDETGTSLKHMHQIKTQIKQHHVQCLVYQNPKPTIIGALASSSTIKAVALDPLAMDISDNKNAWFILMRQLAQQFNHCLSD